MRKEIHFCQIVENLFNQKLEILLKEGKKGK